MSQIKNGGLDQYGTEHFEQQQFGTAGVEGVKVNCDCSEIDTLLQTSLFKLELLFTTVNYTVKKSKVFPYSITRVRHGTDPGFLAVSPQVTLVINLVVGCRYFPPGPRLLSQQKISPPWPVQIILLGDIGTLV